MCIHCRYTVVVVYSSEYCRVVLRLAKRGYDATFECNRCQEIVGYLITRCMLQAAQGLTQEPIYARTDLQVMTATLKS